LQIPLPIALEPALLACIWYSTAIVAHKKVGLVAASALACLALLFPTNTAPLLTGIAFGGVLLAASISRLIGRDWGLPLYIVGLLAAFMLAWSGHLQNTLAFTSWALLSFGVLLYLVSVIERESLLAAGLSWLAVVFVTWSVYDAGLLGEYWWAPIVALLGAAMGVGIRKIVPLIAPMSLPSTKSLDILGILPLESVTSTGTGFSSFLRSVVGYCNLYTISLASAILMGLNGLLFGITQPFYGAIPYALLAYAVVVYGVLLLEKYPQGLFLTVGFAIWGTCLFPLSASYSKQSWTTPFTVAVLTGITLTAGLLGLCIGRLSGSSQTSTQGSTPTNVLYTRFRWNWPWYLVSLVSSMVTLAWCNAVSSTLPAHALTVVLALFLGLAFILMIAERLPDLTLLVIALAVWLIAQTGWATWQMVCAYSLLCLLMFAGQMLWKRIPPVLEVVPSIWLARVMSFSGLGIVILFAIAEGGLSP
jgi:hypothetical protein